MLLNLVVFTFYPIILLVNSQTDSDTKANNKDDWNKCGRHYDFARVVGGSVVQENSFPWIARLSISLKNGVGGCAGAIISPEWVLTAGHCLTNGLEILVVAGDHDKVKEEEFEQRRTSKNFWSHDKYDNDSRNYDVGLIKIDEPFVFNRQVGALCIFDSPGNETVDTSSCLAMGWGATSRDNTSNSEPPVLKKVDVKVSTASKCGAKKSKNRLCVQSSNPDKDGTCSGDSGTPLSCRDADGYFHQVGVNRGGSCKNSKLPPIYSIYINVDAKEVKEWIQEVMSPYIEGEDDEDRIPITTKKVPTRPTQAQPSIPSHSPSGGSNIVIINNNNNND